MEREINKPHSQKWGCQRDILEKEVTERDARFGMGDKGKTQLKLAS